MEKLSMGVSELEEIKIGKIKIDVEKIYPELEDLEITPSGQEQVFKSDKYGYDEVIVKAVESEELNVIPSTKEQIKEGIFNKVTVQGDSDLISNNIKLGSNIFGIDGNLVELKGQEKQITPTTTNQIITPDENYNGLTSVKIGAVTSNIDENIVSDNIKSGVKILGIEGSYEGINTSDATATSNDILEGKVAYAKNERIEGTLKLESDFNAKIGSFTTIDSNSNITEYITEVNYDLTGKNTMNYMFNNMKNLKKIELTGVELVESGMSAFYGAGAGAKFDFSNLNFSNLTTATYMFQAHNMSEIKLPSFPKVTIAKYFLNNNTTIVPEIKVSDMPVLDDGSNMFQNGKYQKIILSNIPKVTLLQYLSKGNTVLNTVVMSNVGNTAPKGVNTYQAFYGCTALKEAQIDTTNRFWYIGEMFYNCSAMETLTAFDGSYITNLSNTFYGCKSLTNFGGIIDLGKAFTGTTANNSAYTLNLSACTNLTHESLMNIINGLYTITVTQQLVLGATNLAKLSPEEIAIATEKGWSVS